MAFDPDKITYIGQTDYRNQKVKFGIKAIDRTRHLYTIGKTGMGKSTLLENMAIQDIQNGEGLAFIDPHGGSAEKILEYIPEHRVKDVIYFAPFDTEYPISFNVMEDVGLAKRHLVVSGLMSALLKLFGEESFSDRMQYILKNTIYALLEYPDTTMLSINKMLIDKTFRNKVIENVTDPSVKAYWTKEYASYTERFVADAIPAIQNKVGQFTSNPIIRNIIGQPVSSFNFREAMDSHKIVIVNLSKGQTGEMNTALLGGLLITKIYLAAMSRADASPKDLAELPNFYLYVDEFQSFSNESFANILSEARKYKLNLNIAHQYIQQMEENVQAAVFGNVGTMVVFRVGSSDAEIFEKEFSPTFIADDLVNLGRFQMYLRLMIDGVGSKPFSATTFVLPPPEGKSFRDEAVEYSRRTYSKGKAEVEVIISKSLEFLEPVRKSDSSQNKSFKVYDDNDPNRFVKRDGASRDYPPRNNYNNNNAQARPQPEFKAFGRDEKDRQEEFVDNRPNPAPIPDSPSDEKKPWQKPAEPKSFVPKNNPPAQKNTQNDTPKIESQVHVSSKMKDILESLDNEGKIELSDVVVDEQNNWKEEKIAPAPVIKKEVQPEKPIDQSRFGKKESNPMHMDALKQALAKAMKDKPVAPPPPPPKNTSHNADSSPKEDIKSNVEDSKPQKTKDEERDQTKEAPEDLLKSIIG
jgi:hypothetical protein